MARITKTRDCIGVHYDSPQDPARHELARSTISRLTHMIKSLNAMLKDFQERRKKDSSILSEETFDIQYRIHNLKKDLKSFED